MSFLHLNRICSGIAGRVSWHTCPALFALSTGRCGSVTLFELLNLSDKIMAFHEPKPRLREELQNAYRDIWDQPARYRRLFSKARYHLVGRARLRGRIYAELTAATKFFASAIAEELPHARFLHLHRHPGGVVRSGMRRGWYQGHPRDDYRVIPLENDPIREKWDREWGAFEKVCWYWHGNIEFILRFEETLAPRRMMTMKFENLVDFGSGAYKLPFDFLGVAPPPLTAVRTVLETRHNEQVTGEFPKYDSWSVEQRETLLQIAGTTMEKLGYE